MSQPSREQQIAALEKDWAENPRWKGIKRNYSAADVVRLRQTMTSLQGTIARQERWKPMSPNAWTRAAFRRPNWI